MARPSPSRAPAIQPARLSAGLRARKMRPATAQRIWALWWSMRPGLNWASAIADVVTRKRAKAAASRPQRRSASRATIHASARNSSAGHRTRVASSARSAPTSGDSAAIIRASGASISRDQCERRGVGAPMRGSVVSSHGAPARSSRTVTRRVASSVSPSQSVSEGPGPASVATTRNSVASSAHARGVAAHRASAGQTGAACSEAGIDIAQPYATPLRPP